MPLHPFDERIRAHHSSHRPRRAASAPLATRAWLKYVLDACNSIVIEGAAHPPSWQGSLTPRQREVLKRRLNSAGAAGMVEPRHRNPKDLDTLWSELRIEKTQHAQGTEPLFETRYAYGRNTPSHEVQDLFARVFPNSSKLFIRPPDGFDPLLYHALDFQNVYSGRALLLRVIAPWEVESSSDGLLVHGDDTGQLDVDAALGDDERKSHAPLDTETHTTLCGEVVEAVACGVYPAEASAGSGRDDAIRRVLSWNPDHRVRITPHEFGDATRSLTDALVAYRLATLLSIDPPGVDTPDIHTQCKRSAAIWLRSALDALTSHPGYEVEDASAFYRPPRSKRTALEDVLTEAGCWYPPVP